MYHCYQISIHFKRKLTKKKEKRKGEGKQRLVRETVKTILPGLFTVVLLSPGHLLGTPCWSMAHLERNRSQIIHPWILAQLPFILYSLKKKTTYSSLLADRAVALKMNVQKFHLSRNIEQDSFLNCLNFFHLLYSSLCSELTDFVGLQTTGLHIASPWKH